MRKLNALFLIFHYGFFHVGYLVFLVGKSEEVVFRPIYFMALIMLILISPKLTEDQRVIVSTIFIVAIVIGIIVYAVLWKYIEKIKPKNALHSFI